MAAAVRTAAAIRDLILVAAKQAGVGEPAASLTAAAAIKLIVSEFGGCRIYIPLHEIARRARDEAIYRNVVENRQTLRRMADVHHLSKSRIAQIVQRMGHRARPPGS